MAQKPKKIADKPEVRFSLLFLFILLSLSAFAGPVECEKAAIKALLKEYVKPANFDEYMRELKLLKVGRGPDYLGHLKGDYQFANQVKVVSGLHTNQGLEFLKKMRPDLADDISISVLPNGVQLADIPKAAIADKRLQFAPIKNKVVDGREIIFTQHTLFPKHWSEEEIIKAVNSVRGNRASFTTIKPGGTFITGKYKGVKIRLIMRDGEVKTAFPMEF